MAGFLRIVVGQGLSNDCPKPMICANFGYMVYANAPKDAPKRPGCSRTGAERSPRQDRPWRGPNRVTRKGAHHRYVRYAEKAAPLLLRFF